MPLFLNAISQVAVHFKLHRSHVCSLSTSINILTILICTFSTGPGCLPHLHILTPQSSTESTSISTDLSHLTSPTFIFWVNHSGILLLPSLSLPPFPALTIFQFTSTDHSFHHSINTSNSNSSSFHPPQIVRHTFTLTPTSVSCNFANTELITAGITEETKSNLAGTHITMYIDWHSSSRFLRISLVTTVGHHFWQHVLYISFQLQQSSHCCLRHWTGVTLSLLTMLHQFHHHECTFPTCNLTVLPQKLLGITPSLVRAVDHLRTFASCL